MKRHISVIEKLGVGETPSGLTPFSETSDGNIQVLTPQGVQNIATAESVIAALGATDRDLVNGYLGWKFGLVGNLPSNHNYKIAPPVVALATY